MNCCSMDEQMKITVAAQVATTKTKSVTMHKHWDSKAQLP